MKRWAIDHDLLRNAEEFDRKWERNGAVAGGEHRVVRYGDRLTKANNLSYHQGWADYFDRLELHNHLFPDTALTLEGFIETPEGLQPLVSQRLEPSIRGATADEVAAFMAQRGFTHTRRGVDFENAQVLIEDLHDENVLIRPDGSLAVIDPVIYLKPGVGLKEVVGTSTTARPMQRDE